MVEWKEIGEICKPITPPKKIPTKDYLNSGQFPVIDQGQNMVIAFTNDASTLVSNDEYVLFGDHTRYVKYFNGSFAQGADGLKILKVKPGIITRYFYFAFQNTEVPTRGYSRHWTIAKALQIPIPSLAEQERIVGILDTFTDSIENLKKQIEQRRKQYEFYRDQLLDLEGKPGVEMKFITDIATNYTGLTYKPENVSENGTLVLRSSNIEEDKLTFKDSVFVQMNNIPQRAIAKEGDILICVRNGSKRLVGKAAMITKEADGMAFGAFMTVLRASTVNCKYLFYLWQSEKVKKQYKGDDAMPIAQITSKDFKRIIIPIISLEEQQRIVSILDKFEASIANLEAQLEQRQKQYEYYRNQLLNFE